MIAILWGLVSLAFIATIHATCQVQTSVAARGNSWESNGVKYQVYDISSTNTGTESIVELNVALTLPSGSAIDNAWNYDVPQQAITNFGGNILPGQSFNSAGLILSGNGPVTIASSLATCPTKKKLKILALHGFYMSAAELSSMTTSLRASFADYADFEFLDGAHILKIEEFVYPNNVTTVTTTTTPVVPPIVTQLITSRPTQAVRNEKAERDEPANGHFAWWHTTEPDFVNLPFYLGLNYSIEKVARFIWEKGPFDGVLGFSQGGTFTSILVNKNQFNFKFAIIWSAYTPNIPEFKQGRNFNTIPSFHINGLSDTIVDRSHSIRLANMFKDRVTFEHPGDHFDVPSGPVFNKTAIDFFKRFL